MNSIKPSKKVKGNRNFHLRPIVLAVAYCFALNAQANPIGAQVVNGTAAVNQSGNLLTVTNSPNAIINWQDFSINSGETTRFIQQSASSAVLNRVLGADPSVLLGTLTSNGKVFLINPNGILVGLGARIDVAGFVASTLNLSNSDFIAGKFNFDVTPNAGAIQNNGAITTTEGGMVYLIAPQIENQGIITTPKGETILAAGNTVQLMDTGTPGVAVQITGSDNNATNLGQILADSGRIGMVAATLKNSGTLSTSSLVSEGGRVFLKATNRVEAGGTISAQGVGGGNIALLADMQNGTVNVTGTLDASAPNSGNGGFIETSAAHVQVADTAHITTAAANGKSGTWLIDPWDFTISAGVAGQSISGIGASTLSALLETTSVVLLTDPSTGGGNGDLLVNGAVSWINSTSSLTLNAIRDININAAINGAGALSATAGRDFNINNTQVIVSGNMIVQVGGNLTLTAASSYNTSLQSSGGTQTINFTGSGVIHQMSILGGNTAGVGGAGANIWSAGLQTIDYITTSGSTLDILVAGGSATRNIYAAYVYNNNVQTQTLICSACATWNWAGIHSDGGQIINASTITVNGGSGGNGNHANIENKSTSVAQTITTTGLISLTGGTAPGYYNASATVNDSVSNDAGIHSDGTQIINAGSITLNGGGDATTLGGAFLTGKGGQSITTTGNLSMTGGLSAQAAQYGLGAPAVIGEEIAANIALNVGGNLTMTGGAGSASPAMIGAAQGAPGISITAATGISMASGGSSSRIGVLTGGPAGTLLMTATAGNISQDASSMINTAIISALASAGTINFAGQNLVNTVTRLYAMGNINYVSAQSVNISSVVSAGSSLLLTAPTINITGTTYSSLSTQIIASSITVSGGVIYAGNNVTATVAGDFRLNNSSHILAVNDVILTFTSPTSTLYLNETTGMPSPSYILTNALLTTTLNFLGRSSGGVVIDGVGTLSTTVGGSGFYSTSLSTPAVLGAGLIVNYSQNLSQIVLALTPPPPASIVLPGQYVAPFTIDASAITNSTGTVDPFGGNIGGTSDTFGGDESTSSTEGGGKDDKDKGKKDENPGKC